MKSSIPIPFYNLYYAIVLFLLSQIRPCSEPLLLAL